VAFLGLVSWIVITRLDAPLSQRLVDLAVYRDAGRSVLSGRGVYSHLTAAPQHLAFTYPPLAALLSVPLAWLPFTLAGVLWTGGELALTVVITSFGFRRLLPRAGRWWPLALGVLAGLAQQLLPLRDEIKFGQVDELVVVLCLLDCVVARPRWPRGMLVGLATAIKLTPGVFIPYLWLTGRRRAAVVAAATFAGLELASAAVIPHDAWRFWTDSLFHTGRLQPNDGTSNQSLRGMLLRAHLPHAAFLALLAVAVVIVAVVGFRRAMLASRHGAEVTGVALTGLLAVLLSPVAWIHHLGWLPLVLGVLADRGRDRRRVAAAIAVYAAYVIKVPWFGRHLVRHDWPLWLARPVEDGFGLVAVLLLFLLPTGGDGVGRFTRMSLVGHVHTGQNGQQQARAHGPARVLHQPGDTLRGGP
jgi:alpha-1,2-mannosyltransferase